MKKENKLYIALSIILYLLFVFIGMQGEGITPFTYIEITLLLILLGRNASFNQGEELTSISRVNILLVVVILVTKYISLML